MKACLKYFLLLLYSVYPNLGFVQEPAAVDSLKIALAGAVTVEEKCHLLDYLSRTMMNVDLKQAEMYGDQLIRVAEESRNRQLMIGAYMSNGLRSSYFSVQKGYVPRAIEYYQKALAIARKEKMEDQVGAVLLRMAAVHLLIPEKDKALAYTNQAFSIISSLSHDSLMVETHNTYGNVYLARNEKIMALRHYLQALRLAESGTREAGQYELLRNCYLHLSRFYSGIEEYDKAIDYSTLATAQLEKTRYGNVPYQRAIDLNAIGNLYAQKNSHDIAISYFRQSISLADSLKFSSLKVPGYISILNQYIRMDQPAKAFEFMQSDPGKALGRYLHDFGFTGVVDQAYGVIFTGLGQLDTARVYLMRAAPYFEKSTNGAGKIGYYQQVARFYKKSGETDNAIDYFLKVKDTGERLGMLDNVKVAAKELDTLFGSKGDYRQAGIFNSIYHDYKDSIEKLNKEKELSQVEAADEQQRQERLARAELEKTRRRNNIQYLAITIGIAAIFIALVLLGMFKVSATTIKLVGFFAFLMFFEFIFLLFKKNIYSITMGEPWKDLLFMIGLAAILLPLHHWLEEKVIRYLTSHNRLTSAGIHLRSQLFRRSKTGSK